MHTQMNINATEDDSRVCECRMNTHRQMQIGAKKLETTHAEAHKDEHAQSRVLPVLCQVRRLSLLFNSVEEGKAWYVGRTHRNTHFPDTLSQQQKDGKRKESVLSEINREIIP